MCTTCGCGADVGPAHRHGPPEGGPAVRRVAVGEAVQARNDRQAAANRARFQSAGTVAFNLLSSPGAGKTTLLVRTLSDLDGRWPMAVIEGDQATDLDSRRIAATGTPAVQINTGVGCHLDAAMVDRAVDALDLSTTRILFIENVGNLVCPASFDLGEAAKVVAVSVTEGDDKPLKYPDMFAAATVLIATKTDLLPHVPASLDRLFANARRVNPALDCIAVSAVSGEGLDDWYTWIQARQPAHDGAAHDRTAPGTAVRPRSANPVTRAVEGTNGRTRHVSGGAG